MSKRTAVLAAAFAGGVLCGFAGALVGGVMLTGNWTSLSIDGGLIGFLTASWLIGMGAPGLAKVQRISLIIAWPIARAHCLSQGCCAGKLLDGAGHHHPYPAYEAAAVLLSAAIAMRMNRSQTEKLAWFLASALLLRSALVLAFRDPATIQLPWVPGLSAALGLAAMAFALRLHKTVSPV